MATFTLPRKLMVLSYIMASASAKIGTLEAAFYEDTVCTTIMGDAVQFDGSQTQTIERDGPRSVMIIPNGSGDHCLLMSTQAEWSCADTSLPLTDKGLACYTLLDENYQSFRIVEGDCVQAKDELCKSSA